MISMGNCPLGYVMRSGRHEVVEHSTEEGDDDPMLRLVLVGILLRFSSESMFWTSSGEPIAQLPRVPSIL